MFIKIHLNNMKNFYIFLISLIFLSVGFLVLAQELPPTVTFPITELDNCQSEEDCRDYCERFENAIPCLDFAEEHGILPQEEIDAARRMIGIIGEDGGPGGCTSEAECDTYCDDPANIEECIIFAREHDLIPADELEEIDQVLAAVRRGAIPPRCHGREECDEYCSRPENIEECIEFSIAAGFMSAEEAEMVRKTGGKGPGDCRGKEECDAFCDNPDNMEECIRFGLQYGLMPPGEEEEARKMLEVIEKGIRPPPCQSEEECQVYCSRPEHAVECIDFAVAIGHMTAEEAEQVKKMAEMGITGGPGGCQSEEECKAFCENPNNMEECMKFAVMLGEMTQEEYDRNVHRIRVMAEGGPGGCKTQEECDVICRKQEYGDQCLDFAVRLGDMTQEEVDRIRAMKQMQQGPMPGEGSEGMIPPPDGMMMPPPDGVMPPPDGMMEPPSPEEMERMRQQEEERIRQMEMERMMEEAKDTIKEMVPTLEMPPPEEPEPTEETQSLLDQFEKLLAALIAFRMEF
jgi:hypothetical protein